jgi:hypothetical protein
MPINCGILAGIDADCASLRKPGGLSKDAYVFNLSDLRVPITTTQGVYITDLEFNTYRSLYKLSSTKYSHEAVWAEQTSDGGNKSYQQTVTLRLFNSTPDDDKVIEDLGVAEVGVIIKTNAGDWEIWGAENGLSANGSTGGAGRQATDATTSQIVLVGTERFLPKRLLIGGSNALTAQYIAAMVA